MNFQKTYISSSTNTFSRGYTGHEMLYQFGLINMNVPIKREQSQVYLNFVEREAHRGEASTSRVYNPILGRILSPDKFVQNVYATQNYNRYSYCANNPIIYNDISGYKYDGTNAFDLAVQEVTSMMESIGAARAELQAQWEEARINDLTNSLSGFNNMPANDELLQETSATDAPTVEAATAETPAQEATEEASSTESDGDGDPPNGQGTSQNNNNNSQNISNPAAPVRSWTGVVAEAASDIGAVGKPLSAIAKYGAKASLAGEGVNVGISIWNFSQNRTLGNAGRVWVSGAIGATNFIPGWGPVISFVLTCVDMEGGFNFAYDYLDSIRLD